MLPDSDISLPRWQPREHLSHHSWETAPCRTSLISSTVSLGLPQFLHLPDVCFICSPGIPTWHSCVLWGWAELQRSAGFSPAGNAPSNRPSDIVSEGT